MTREELTELAACDAKETFLEDGILDMLYSDTRRHYEQEPKFEWLREHYKLEENPEPTEEEFRFYQQAYRIKLRRAERFLEKQADRLKALDENDDDGYGDLIDELTGEVFTEIEKE